MRKAKFSDAKWIWYERPLFDLVNSWMETRRTFIARNIPKKVVVAATADTAYRLYVNGALVNQGPARGFQVSWPYDEVDITSHIKRGRNVIAALVQQLGVGNAQYIHAGGTGFILAGEVDGMDVSTGPAWRVRKAPGFKKYTRRVCREQGFQEHFDARLDDGAWLAAEYKEDSSWKNAAGMNFGGMPWHSLEPRGIPLLKRACMTPEKLLSVSEGKAKKGAEDVEDVVGLFVEEKKRWVKNTKRLEGEREWGVFSVSPVAQGKYRAYLLDFGKEVVGSIHLRLAGCRGGEIIDTLVCETASNAAPDILSPEATSSHQAFGNRLVCKKGITEHEMFSCWGFRYLVVVCRGITRPVRLKVALNWAGYPLQIKGSFSSSDQKLNAIYAMSSWTQQCCMLDAYVDCPWREQSQWWGDIRVQALNTFYLSADTRLFERGLRQIARQALPNGLLYAHAPTISHDCILPDFTLTWLITQWDYYWQTGDLAVFKEMTPKIHEILNFFEDSMDKKIGLLHYDARYALFLDWCDIFRDGYSTLYNMIYLMALRHISALFRLSGEDKSANICSRRAKQLLHAMKKRLFNRGQKYLYGGLSWGKKAVIQNSPHLDAFVILLDIFPEVQKRAEENLVAFCRSARKDGIIPSPFFMFYVFEALKKKGRMAEVIDCIARWWGEMVALGFTTTIERWDFERGQTSMCHAWSAHPIVHFSNILLGIWQAAPGWGKIRFSPCFTPTDAASGAVSTPRGLVRSSWARKNGKIVVHLKIPKNMTAQVALPGLRENLVKDEKTWVIKDDFAAGAEAHVS